jgi:signal transduction histidine kinase
MASERQAQHEDTGRGAGDAPWADRSGRLSQHAHDLNNLLQVVGSSLHLMEREVDQPELVRARLATAMAGLIRCAVLTRQMYPSAPAPDEDFVVLQSVVEAVEPLLAAAAGPDVEVELSLAAAPLTTFIDRTGLERALLNLVVNASQAIVGPGRIRVSCHGDIDHIELTVDDSGAGFSAEAAANAFEPHFTTRRAGSGLGLASVRSFVDAAGGTVRLSRADIGGARVVMTLPRQVPKPRLVGASRAF